MIDLNKVRAGNIATVLLQGEYKMNKGGTKGTAINKYYGRVTRDYRFTITLAGEETYYNIYPDAVGKPAWFQFIQAGLVRHNKTGQLYLAGLPTNSKNNRFDLYIDGQPITEEEYNYIQNYRSDSDKPKFLTIAIDNVTNIAD
jgi:hypothetical protein